MVVGVGVVIGVRVVVGVVARAAYQVRKEGEKYRCPNSGWLRRQADHHTLYRKAYQSDSYGGALTKEWDHVPYKDTL